MADKETRKMTFTIEKVANMVFIVGDSDVVFKAWDDEGFTERKLQNAMKRIAGNYQGPVEFIRTF